MLSALDECVLIAVSYDGRCILRSDLDNKCSYWEYLESNGKVGLLLGAVGGSILGATCAGVTLMVQGGYTLYKWSTRAHVRREDG